MTRDRSAGHLLATGGAIAALVACLILRETLDAGWLGYPVLVLFGVVCFMQAVLTRGLEDALWITGMLAAIALLMLLFVSS